MSRYEGGQFPKHCRKCGAIHTPETWESLPFVGRQLYVDELLELRNCSCKSTLAVVIEQEAELGSGVRNAIVLGAKMAVAS